MPDQLATLRSFVKWADRIEYPDAAPTLVSRAFQEMLSGRRGPVALEMPWTYSHSARIPRRPNRSIFPGTAARHRTRQGRRHADRQQQTPISSSAAAPFTPVMKSSSCRADRRAGAVAFRSGRASYSNAHELG